MAQIGGVKTIIVKEGQEEEFVQLFNQLSEYVTKEPGNLYYDLFKSRSIARGYIVTECYIDHNAWQAHQDSEYGKHFFPKIREILESITVEYFDEV